MYHRLPARILLLSALGGASSSVVCPDSSWAKDEATDKCFKLIGDPDTSGRLYTQSECALAACSGNSSIAASLAGVDDALLPFLYANFAGALGGAYIGLYQGEDSEGVGAHWDSWAAGGNTTWHNWAAGEPNDFCGVPEVPGSDPAAVAAAAAR